MALKVFDGYDHYAAQIDFLSRAGGFLQYSEPGTNASPISFVTGVNGFGKAVRISTNVNPTYFVFADRNASAFDGFHARFVDTGDGAVFYFMDSTAATGSQNQVVVYFNPFNYSVQIFRGGTSFSGGAWNGALLYQSGNNAWSGQVWNFLEFGVVINGSTGSVTVKVENDIVATVTGVNTNNSGNAWWDTMGVQGVNRAGSSPTLDIDNFYYCDTVVGPGAIPCNTFLGDCKVDTTFADGNGSVQWTPLALTNWQEVSEVAFDGDTTYNFTSTPTDEDLLNFGPLDPLVITVIGVQITGAYRKDDAGTRTLKQTLLSGATQVYGTTRSLPDSYVYWTDLFVVDPDTGVDWTRTGVDAISAGYNLVS